MSLLDILVLTGTLVGIAVYGAWRTRGNRDLEEYFGGDHSMRWGTIGLSVMATQASAVTFLSTLGFGYEKGMEFVQNYLGLPLALVLVSALFIPVYYRCGVYTAYEYLERRFDLKTRQLGALLFLVQRGLAAGITLYAPAIIVSNLLGWDLDSTILLTGLLVVAYTVAGGSRGVSLSQKHQMAVILVGMGFRNAVLVSFAIPFTMLLSILVLDLMGITLNTITLFSLILALGMLLDNAIVFVENIYRHHGMGLPRARAALVGTSEVAWPVIYSTATTVGAFLPMLFWPGVMGEFMSRTIGLAWRD